MSDNWSLDDLDLSEVEADSGEMRLKPGRYVCKITHASLEKITDGQNAGGRRLQLAFADTQGNGTIKESLNLHLPKSPKAQDIGRKALKTLLTHGGHPTPNKLEDVNSVKGLTVGVNVAPDTFKNDKGETIQTSSVHGWHPFFNPEGALNLGPSAPAAAPAASGKHPNQTGGAVVTDDDFDDIPF